MPLPADFNAHIVDLQTQALSLAGAAGVPGVLPRRWQVPTAYPLGTPPQDPAGFKEACDRTALNALAVAAYQTGGDANAGRAGQIVGLKAAIDHQAAYERALHARHAGGVRLRAWAAARRSGHGDVNYGVFAAARLAAEGHLSAATAAPNTPTA